jgi:hypothetical protein
MLIVPRLLIRSISETFDRDRASADASYPRHEISVDFRFDDGEDTLLRNKGECLPRESAEDAPS